jgi:hypothetical protein
MQARLPRNNIPQGIMKSRSVGYTDAGVLEKYVTIPSRKG